MWVGAVAAAKEQHRAPPAVPRGASGGGRKDRNPGRGPGSVRVA